MILIVDCGSNKTPYIATLVDEFMDVKTVPVFDLDAETIQNYSGVIISGAPILITEQDILPFLKRIEWIDTVPIPVLGICFGHQLIGIHFGSSAHRMKDDRDWQLIETFEDSRLIERLPTEFEMMEDHCETISIPANFKLIGSSDACVNEIMEHKSKPIYGVQFHPEVSGNYGAVLIENFVKICQQIND